MNKLQKNAAGFSAVEAVLVIIVIALVGAVGFLVYKNQSKTTTASTETTTATSKANATETADPYADWKTHTLKYEKASFKYPSSWTMEDTSFADAQTTGGGVDSVKLTGTNGFEMTIIDGGPNDYGFPAGGLTSIHTDPVTFLGKSAYMNIAQAGASNTGVADYINLTTTKTSLTDFPTDKTVVAPTYKTGVTENKFLILMNYNANVEKNSANPIYPHKELAAVLKDVNYTDAKLVISSFSY